MTLNPKPKTWG